MLVKFQYVRTSHGFLVISPITYDVKAAGKILNSSIFPSKENPAISKLLLCLWEYEMVNVQVTVFFNAPSIYNLTTPKLLMSFITVTNTLYHTPFVNGIFGPCGSP
jgi:hypothetical protein